MNFIDFILNIVGLLLWFNWRAGYFNSASRHGGALGFTLKAAKAAGPHWLYLGILLGLLVLRAFFYWQIGPALPWTPHLCLGCITLLFRSDFLIRMILYSFVSFGALLGVFYLWLLILSCLNRNVSEENPQQRFVQLHLGLMRNAPVALKLLLPLVVAVSAWLLLHPLLVQMQMTPKCSKWHLLEQGAIIGSLVYLQLEYLLVGVVLLHLLNSYVFMGHYSFFKFIELTAANLLRPLRTQGLIVKRIDMAPLIGAVLLIQFFALLTWASRSSWAVKHFEKLAS